MVQAIHRTIRTSSSSCGRYKGLIHAAVTSHRLALVMAFLPVLAAASASASASCFVSCHRSHPRSGSLVTSGNSDRISLPTFSVGVTPPSRPATAGPSLSSPLTACGAVAPPRHRRGGGGGAGRSTKRGDTGILAVERSLVVDRGFSFVLGSDESGTGCIAGPVVAATCCILPLGGSGGGGRGGSPARGGHKEGHSSAPSSAAGAFERYRPIQLVVSGGTHIRDSKQLTPEEREAVYEEIVANPHIYDFTVAQRSNQEIDATNNILASTMECFQESIQELAGDFLLCSNGDGDADGGSCRCYSIVDGQKAPQIKLGGAGDAGGAVLPCRPFVRADSQVLTVALASIIAKVTRDRMAAEWHEQHPEYGFDVHKGYATREHIEAIHRHGPCPLHRMTFKSLKGR